MSRGDPPSETVPPPWERAARDLLRETEKRATVLDLCTPTNLGEELALLETAFARGQARAPRFVYRPMPDGDLGPTLEETAAVLQDRGPLATLYAKRARELALEEALCRAVGSPGFAELAARRYATCDAHDRRASTLCRRWVSDPEAEEPSPEVVSDDEGDPRSLLNRMRREVGRRCLAVRVMVSARMAALAAVGAGVIYIAAGRRLTVHDVERTVLHEVLGHALPRQRAARLPLGIFSSGTARGSDEQEGRALNIEHEAGMLSVTRRRELGRRHIAAEAMRAGAGFVETARLLETDTGTTLPDALRIAARVHRGGGLGRELVYVPAYLRVRAALSEDRLCDVVLGSGRVATDAIATLRPWVGDPAREA